MRCYLTTKIKIGNSFLSLFTTGVSIISEKPSYTIALYSNCLNPTSHIFRGSAVGSALDLESNGCWFEPTVRHYFSSNNARLLA